MINQSVIYVHKANTLMMEMLLVRTLVVLNALMDTQLQVIKQLDQIPLFACYVQKDILV